MRFTKETAKRALRTFIQTALAYICVNIAIVDFSEEQAAIKSALVGLVISAVSAGLAAVMNLEKEDIDNE